MKFDIGFPNALKMAAPASNMGERHQAVTPLYRGGPGPKK